MPRAFDRAITPPPEWDPERLQDYALPQLPSDFAEMILAAVMEVATKVIQHISDTLGFDLMPFLGAANAVIINLQTIFGSLNPLTGEFNPQEAVQALFNIAFELGISLPLSMITGLIDEGGDILDSLIPGLDTSKIISDTFPLSMITGLIDEGGQIVTDLLNVPLSAINGLLGVGGDILDSLIPGLDTSKIISGTFPMSMITGLVDKLEDVPILGDIVEAITGIIDGGLPDLSAWAASVPELIGGLLNVDWIPGLDTSKIISGTFPLSMITGLLDTGGKIITSLLDVPLSVINGLLDTGGAIFNSLIPGLDTSKITSGTFPQAMLDITSIPANIVSGVLATLNIPNLAASKITSGAFNVARIPGLDVSKIISGVFGTSFIPGLDTSKITSGTFAQSMLDIVNIPANIVSGVLDAARIPGLDVSKITSGQFAQSMVNLTDIPATIVSGILDAARIPGLAASKIISGSFNVARIPGLDVSKIVSGVFGTSFIPGIDTSKIISGIFQPSLLPDITASMSTDLQGAIDAGVNALKNTPGIIGQAFSDFEDALSAIPTQIFNKFGGNSAPRASSSQAAQAMTTLQSTINSHTSAISALQSIVDSADGFREVITFKQPETITYNSGYSYVIPSWATYVDGIYLGAGGGGMGGNPLIPVHGEGGDAGQWVTETLTRGTDFPSGGATLTGSCGLGGNGGNVNTAGGAGTSTQRNAISGGKAAISANGGAGGNIQDTNQAGGDSPGDITYQGITYFGGDGGGSHAGQHGRKGGPGAGGGGGAGATWFIAWTGGDGGDGTASFTARAAMPAAFTSMGNKIVPAFRLNTGTCSTDAQTVAAAWARVPQYASGYMLALRADSTFSNMVYLRVQHVGNETQYTIGRMASNAALDWKTATIAEAIPFNAFSLASDDDYTFTVAINGSPIDSYVDAAHSSSKGPSYRHGGWGSSSDGLPGSIIQFAFFDSGTPSRITSATVATAQTTVSATFTDLPTTGPSVTLNVPPSGEVTVEVSSTFQAGAAGQVGFMGFVLSGSNTLAADDSRAALGGAPLTNFNGTISRRFHLTGLTPGTTTFKAMYRRSAGNNASFADRSIIVEPKP